MSPKRYSDNFVALGCGITACRIRVKRAKQPLRGLEGLPEGGRGKILKDMPGSIPENSSIELPIRISHPPPSSNPLPAALNPPNPRSHYS